MKKMRTWLALFMALLLLPVTPGLADEAVEIVPEVTACFENPPVRPAWRAIRSLENGGFLLFGDAAVGEGGSPACATALVNAEGTTLSTLHTGEPQSAFYMNAVPLPDGGYAMLSHTGSNDKEAFAEMDITRVRSGEIIGVEKVYPGDGAPVPELLPAEDGFFACYGERKEKDRHGGTFHVPVLEKRDTDGKILWRTVFDEHELHFNGAVSVPGGTILYGFVEEQKTGKRIQQGIAVKMSGAGEILWATETPSDFMKVYQDALPMPDGGLLAVGRHTRQRKEKIGVNPAVGVLACFGPDGALLWEREYDLGLEAIEFTDIRQAPSGYYVYADVIDYRPPLHLLLLDEAGTIEKHWTIAQEGEWDVTRVRMNKSGDTLRLITVERRDVDAESEEKGATARIRMLTITP